MTGRIVAIVQARMASSRLPGKVMEDIHGEPMLVRVVERAQQAQALDEVVVATTTDPQDDVLEALCDERGYACYRGHPFDVLDRFLRAAQSHRATVVVRLTGDCPLIDPELIDQTVRAFLAADPPVDFASNRLPRERTYPIGLDTEVCSYSALERAWNEADQPYHREHVMPYLYEVPGRFRTLLLHSEEDHGDLRWSVDTVEDLELVRQIYALMEGVDTFSWKDVLAAYDRAPWLATINAAVEHRTEHDVDSRMSG